MSNLFVQKQVKALFPPRDPNSNKGDFGRITLLGGSTKYSGAIRLAEMACAAMRSGAGLCRVAAPKNLENVILPALLESVYYPLSEKDGELVYTESELKELMGMSDVIALGMGLGKTEETKKIVRYLLMHFEGTLIVDADGINCMAEMKKEELKKIKGKLVLTPHPKEFSRLSKVSVEVILEKPEENVMNLASFLNAVILLKGHVTYVSDGKTCYRVEKGGPGMATAGSGDVLAGIMAAMMANAGDNLLDAAAGAAYINGLAGEIAERLYGDTSQIASDTARSIGLAIQAIRSRSVLFGHVDLWTGFGTKLAIAAAVLMVVAGSVFGIGKVIPMLKAQAAPQTEIMDAEEDFILSLDFVMKDIYIDGVLVNNYQLYRPFGQYDGRIYVPLTEDVCSALGLEASWEIYDGEMYLYKTNASGEGAFYDVNGWDLAPIKGWAKSQMKLHIVDGTEEEILECEPGAVLSYNDGEVFYVQLGMLRDSTILDISLHYDDYTGLYISTDPKKPAKGYYSKNNYDYIMGRADYISGFNNGLSLGDGVYYEYLFRHEANTYKVEEDLVLSVARTESSFYVYAQSGAGARGIMQIMPDTAKAHGIDPEELFTLHPSVRFGALYLRDALHNFKGDVVKALSAYNWGGSAVLAGEYDTGYADTVLSRKAAMQRSIADKGYSNTFETKVTYHQ